MDGWKKANMFDSMQIYCGLSMEKKEMRGELMWL